MEKVTGIGGAFFRAKDPEALSAWYEQHLGIAGMGDDSTVWRQEAGPTVFAPFAETTEYFGRPDQMFMFNFRVSNLDAMLSQLRAAGVDVDDKIEVQEGIGRFGWATDPEGNRFELWEPSLDSPKT